MKGAKDIDEYIAMQPGNVQKMLKGLRKAIKEAAPMAKETISYQIPTFELNGFLVHFGAFKDHVSFFPTSSPRRHFKELSRYGGGPGAIVFPLGRPIPYGLVSRIVKFRVKENAKAGRV